jgi:hypothetical protein
MHYVRVGARRVQPQWRHSGSARVAGRWPGGITAVSRRWPGGITAVARLGRFPGSRALPRILSIQHFRADTGVCYAAVQHRSGPQTRPLIGSGPKRAAGCGCAYAAASTSACAAERWAQPVCARARRAAKSASAKVPSSAVACTSTRPPAPVMTKFASAWAAASSA